MGGFSFLENYREGGLLFIITCVYYYLFRGGSDFLEDHMEGGLFFVVTWDYFLLRSGSGF